MQLFKTIFLFILTGIIVIITLPFGILAIIFSFLGLKKPMSIFTYKIAQSWARLVFIVSGCTITIIGKDNIPKQGGVCFMSNHGSAFDIILMLAFIGRPFGFIAKKELGYIPLFNAWIYILGGLFINRNNPRKGLKTINKGVKRLQKGNCILVFPEGRRSRNQGLLPFKPGSFKLATQSGVPIVPIAISNSYEVYERNRRLTPAPVRIVFCAPVSTDHLQQENRKQILADQLHGIISAALAE